MARAMPVAAVLGNHDAEYGTEHVAKALEEHDIRVLFATRYGVSKRKPEPSTSPA